MGAGVRKNEAFKFYCFFCASLWMKWYFDCAETSSTLWQAVQNWKGRSSSLTLRFFISSYFTKKEHYCRTCYLWVVVSLHIRAWKILKKSSFSIWQCHKNHLRVWPHCHLVWFLKPVCHIDGCKVCWTFCDQQLLFYSGLFGHNEVPSIQNIGVDMEEFRKVSSWVTQQVKFLYCCSKIVASM